jgi:acyl carrier protein
MPIIFDKIRTILCTQFSFQYDQIQPEARFEIELGTDSREMLELLSEFEKTFNIEINLDDIDKMVEEGKFIRIQDAVDYIEEKINIQE